jgi:hypothetical protein
MQPIAADGIAHGIDLMLSPVNGMGDVLCRESFTLAPLARKFLRQTAMKAESSRTFTRTTLVQY